MTTYYLDPENGNDANTGLSFAQRRRTYASLAASYAAGDVIRVIADYGVKSLGNGTWTDNSTTLTLAAAVTQTIDDFASTTGWVPSSNVTVQNYASGSKISNNSLWITTNGSFAGGLAAYKALSSPLDLSAFQALSTWVYPFSGAFGVGVWRLALCSDSAGAVPVQYHDLSGMNSTDGDTTNTNGWHPQCLDTGANLPSGINSIAIYCTTANRQIRLNNWIACYSKTASNHLSHECAIGKNTTGEPEWYTPQYINGTSITLGAYWTPQTATTPNYRSPNGTQTVATYAICPLKANIISSKRTLSGSSGAAVTMSGGWDRTAMSTQSGFTWLNGSWDYPAAWGFGGGNNQRNWSISNIGFIGFTDYPINWNGQDNITVSPVGIVSCGFAVPQINGNNENGYFNYYCGAVTYTYGPAFKGYIGDNMRGVVQLASFVNGQQSAIAGMTSSGGSQNYGKPNIPFIFGRVAGNNGAGIYCPGGFTMYVKDTQFQYNSSADVAFATQQEVVFDNCTWTKSSLSGYTAASTLRATNNGGSATDHTLLANGYQWNTTTTTQSGTGIGWQVAQFVSGMNPGPSANGPADMYIDKIAVAAGAPVTYKRWIYVSNANMNAGLSVEQSAYFGIGQGGVSVAYSGTPGNWQQVTLTFTPAKSGVIPIKAWAWNSNNTDTTSYATFSDMSVSQ